MTNQMKTVIDPRERRDSLKAQIDAAVHNGDTSVDVRALTAELRNAETECADLDIESAIKANAAKAAQRAQLIATRNRLLAEQDELYSVVAVESGLQLAAALWNVSVALDEMARLQRRSRELSAQIGNLSAQLGERNPTRGDVLHNTRISHRVISALNALFVTAEASQPWFRGRRVSLRDLWKELKRDAAEA